MLSKLSVLSIRRTPATAPQHIPTKHDMLPQHLVCKYQLNCEYCNITLARNKAPWWWSDKIKTCRSVSKCFMWNYMCICWLIHWSDSAMCTVIVICPTLIVIDYRSYLGTAVAQWLRCCATNRKVAGSIPAGVIGIIHWHKILPVTLWPRVDSASNRNEYQEYFLGVKAAGA